MGTTLTHVTFPWIGTGVPITFAPAESVGGEEKAFQNVPNKQRDFESQLNERASQTTSKRLNRLGPSRRQSR